MCASVCASVWHFQLTKHLFVEIKACVVLIEILLFTIAETSKSLVSGIIVIMTKMASF